MKSSQSKIIKIESVEYLGDYKLKIKFGDGKQVQLDFYCFLSSSLNPHIYTYLNKKKFAQFLIVDSDLMWGDFDLCFPIYDLYSGKFSSDSKLKIKKSA